MHRKSPKYAAVVDLREGERPATYLDLGFFEDDFLLCYHGMIYIGTTNSRELDLGELGQLLILLGMILKTDVAFFLVHHVVVFLIQPMGKPEIETICTGCHLAPALS